MKKTTMFIFAALALVLPAWAAIESGLKVGEPVTPFHPNHVSGPNKGTQACPPCTYGARPAIQAWINGDDMRNVETIASSLNKAVLTSKHELKAFLIVLTNSDAEIDAVKKMAIETKNSDIGIAYLSAKDHAVQDYKINLASEVKNTIFLYKDKRVVSKFVNFKADKKGLVELDTAIDKIDQ